MNPEVKQAWLAALESGQYKWGTGQLKVGDTFCCLGVLADLYCKQHPGESGWDENDTLADTKDIQRRCGFLPSQVCEWAGLEYLPNSGLNHNPDNTQLKLSEINDSRLVADFTRAAAYIRDNL